MFSLPEQLRADLNALQSFIISQRFVNHDDNKSNSKSSATAEASSDAADHQQQQQHVTDTEHDKANITADAAAEPVSAARTHKGTICAAVVDSSPLADTVQQLQAELKAVTAELHAERAIVAQVRLQQRCDAATTQNLSQQLRTAEENVKQVTRERDGWRQRCGAAEASHVECTTSRTTMREHVRALEAAMKQNAGLYTTLTSAAADAQRTMDELVHENRRLHCQLESQSKDLVRLAAVELDMAAAQARVRFFEQEHDAWVTEVSQLRERFQSVQADVEASVRFWKAWQHEHATLKTALAQSEAQCVQWAKLFSSSVMHPERANIPAPSGARPATVNPSSSPLADCEPEVGHLTQQGDPSSSLSSACDDTACTTANEIDITNSNEDEEGSSRNASACHSAVFAQQLEAKVADLALQLYTAQARATAAEDALTQLTQTRLTDCAMMLTLKSMLCALRPQVDKLAATNAQLQARVLATESLTEPLMQHVMQLTEALTQEVCARQALEDAEQAKLTFSDTRKDVNLSTTCAVAAAAIGASTATELREAKGTVNTEVEGSVATVGGKRQRLRVTALKPRYEK